MVAKVKVADFVASSARYAEKVSLAADKDGNKKLSVGEAKSLPKDLRDDYARMAKKNAAVTPAGFARDQAAYVAASARKADKNKDGALTKTEAKSLPVDLRDNYANYAASLSSSVGSGTFVGRGKGKNDTLGGMAFTRLPVSTQTQATMKKLTTDSEGTPSFAAAWKGKPAELAAMLADPQAHKDFFNDALFHGTGTTYQRDYPQYYTPDGLETLKPLSASQALTALTSGFQENNTSAATAADAKKLIDGMNEPGTKFIQLGWTNHDDASFAGVFAINPTTGQMKCAGWYNEP